MTLSGHSKCKYDKCLFVLRWCTTVHSAFFANNRKRIDFNHLMQSSRVRSFEQLLTGKSVESPICRAPSGTFVSTHYHVTRHLIKLGIMSVCCCCCYRLIASKYFEGWSKSAVLNSLIFWANLILSRGTIMLSAMMIQFRGNFVLPASPIVSILRNSTGRNVTQQVSNTLVAADL